MANKEINSDIDVLGRIYASTVPNSTGSIVTWNSTTRGLGLRTNAQIISDLNLSSNFIPLTGTEVSKPLTGNIEVDATNDRVGFYSEDNNRFIGLTDDGLNAIVSSDSSEYSNLDQVPGGNSLATGNQKNQYSSIQTLPTRILLNNTDNEDDKGNSGELSIENYEFRFDSKTDHGTVFDGTLSYNAKDGLYVVNNNGGYVKLSEPGLAGVLNSRSFSLNKNTTDSNSSHLLFPDSGITVRRIPVSVNGNFANQQGEITIPTGGGGSVTSVGLTAPTGFSVSNSPITTAGNIALSYASGYQGFLTTDKNKLDGLSNYNLPIATATVLGGIYLFSDTVQTVDVAPVSTIANRTYGVQLTPERQAVVNVPWTDTNTTYTSSNGIALTGTNFSPTYGTTANTIAQGNDNRINNGQTAFNWGDPDSKFHKLALRIEDAYNSYPYENIPNLDANNVIGNISVYPGDLSTNVMPNSHLLSFGTEDRSWQMNKHDSDKRLYVRTKKGTWTDWDQLAYISDFPFETVTSYGDTAIVRTGRDSQYFANFGNNAIDFSYADGTETVLGTIGEYTFATGLNNRVRGIGSSAFGSSHTVSGKYSAAFGYGNRTPNYASFVIGQYADSPGEQESVWTPGSPVFIVGNGGDIKDGDPIPSNAYVLNNDGTSVQYGKAAYGMDFLNFSDNDLVTKKYTKVKTYSILDSVTYPSLTALESLFVMEGADIVLYIPNPTNYEGFKVTVKFPPAENTIAVTQATGLSLIRTKQYQMVSTITTPDDFGVITFVSNGEFWEQI